MAAPEYHLEVRTRLPARASRKPPLLFIHGGYCDAWSWEPYFLPWFAARGYPAHALSLRGHGASGGKETLFIASLDDYVADVEHVAAMLNAPPILIGHSIGAAICERMLATRPVRGTALLAPVPPSGLMPVAARLATANPNYLPHLAQMDPGRMSADLMTTLRPFYFSDGVEKHLLATALQHLSGESPRVLFDLSLRLHWAPAQRSTTPVFVLGAEGDRISTPEDTRATASHHHTTATILPGMAHMLMLDPEWLTAAKALAAWVATVE